MLGSQLRQSVIRFFPNLFASNSPQSRNLFISTVYEADKNRSRYIKGGSNRQDISPETKELLKHARDPDDMSSQLGYSIEEPITMDLSTEERTRALQYEVPYLGYASEVNNGTDSIKYYPYSEEEISNTPPSPVLMVTKVKNLKGEPYWVKDFCQQIGLHNANFGQGTIKIGKRVFLPNLPSVVLILYRIKHVVDIQPVTFPNGMPDDFHPEKHGFKLTHKGEFIVEGPPKESLESIAARADWMKITTDHISKEARRHWDNQYSSPLGNHNYHNNPALLDPRKSDSQFVRNQKIKWS